MGKGLGPEGAPFREGLRSLSGLCRHPLPSSPTALVPCPGPPSCFPPTLSTLPHRAQDVCPRGLLSCSLSTSTSRLSIPPPSSTHWCLTARTRPGASVHDALCRPSRAPRVSARVAGSPPAAASRRPQAASQILSAFFPRHTLGQCTKPCWIPCPSQCPGKPIQTLSSLTSPFWTWACSKSPGFLPEPCPPPVLLPSVQGTRTPMLPPCLAGAEEHPGPLESTGIVCPVRAWAASRAGGSGDPQ